MSSISRSTSLGSYEKGRPSYGRFRWPSNWQFLMGTVCYSVSYTGYNTFISNAGKKPGVWQYLAISIHIGLPIFYTQIFLGQFSQMSMLNFRYLMPMARGLMYTFLVCVVLKTIRCGYVLTDSLLYFLMCFQPVLPWAECPEGYEHICESSNLTDGYPHTAYVFWKYIYAGNPTMDLTIDFSGLPELSTLIGFCMQWVFMFVVAAISYTRHKKITRVLFYIYFLGMLVLLVSMYASVGRNYNIFSLLFAQVDELLVVETWLGTGRSVISELCLAELYNMYSGAHLSQKAPSGTLSLGCVILIGSCNFLASLLTNICYYAISENTPHRISVVTPHVLGIGVGHILVVIPQGLSYMSFPQGWCAIFFGSLICMMESLPLDLHSAPVTLQPK